MHACVAQRRRGTHAERARHDLTKGSARLRRQCGIRACQGMPSPHQQLIVLLIEIKSKKVLAPGKQRKDRPIRIAAAQFIKQLLCRGDEAELHIEQRCQNIPATVLAEKSP